MHVHQRLKFSDDDVGDADDWGDSGRTLFLTFDGENWVKYDLSLLPESYHQRNTRERVEFTFRTNAPDGLLWFSGSEQNNVQLSLRVRSAQTIINIIIIIKAICNAQDPLKKAANALSGSEKM